MSDAIDKLQDLWFAWDQGSVIGMADTINAIRPALDEMAEARAEIARLTAELAAARKQLDAAAEAGIRRGRSWEATEWEAAFGVRNRREAVAKLRAAEDALAAARAVPADVEAAMRHYGEVNSSPCWTAKGHADAEDTLRTAIARAISDATAARGTVGGLLATAPVGAIVEWSRDGRWRRSFAGATPLRSARWSAPWGWSGMAFELDAAELREHARLVPPDLADLAPSTRGPLPKGG